MEWIAEIKFHYENIFVRSQRYAFGDIYGISFLKEYRIPKTYHFDIATKPAGEKKIALYVICDSYIADNLQPNYFTNVDTVYYADWRDENQTFELDTTKTNILIIESVERYFMYRFYDKDKLKYGFSNLAAETKSTAENVYTKITSGLFNSEINDNLEFVLFDNKAFTFFKHLRTTFNQRCFDRIPSCVTISDDKKYLFLSETTDSTQDESSFYNFTTDDVQKRVANVDTMAQHYKQSGFDKVYLSVIPNPVTIIGYKNLKYNNLLPMIDSTKAENFENIDVYREFKASHKQIFCYADTHWNANGLQIWINKVDEVLKIKKRMCK